MSIRTDEIQGRPGAAFPGAEGEEYARIEGIDRLPPFLMSIPTDTDLWMFITSRGGLTAGRVDADGSLFPYETVDRLHDSVHYTAPVTLVRVRPNTADEVLWEPLSDRFAGGFRVERTLYKNSIGNRVIFEEVNLDLGLLFRYRWAGCDEFGWVRTSTLENLGPDAVLVRFLDGLRNILPWGVPLSLMQQSSSLVDAYRRADLDLHRRLGVFSLTAKVSDRPEPAEVLRANTAWYCGLTGVDVHLSPYAEVAFRRGEQVMPGGPMVGRRGNYLVETGFTLQPGEHRTWHIAADVGRSHLDIAALRHLILNGDAPGAIEDALNRAGEGLVRIVASADGLELTGDGAATVHHFANVLFNVMRGGTFYSNDAIPVADFRAFLDARNRGVADRQAERLRGLPGEIPVAGLYRLARGTGDRDLERLAHEYLPLWFGRRHGDPSRPWNRFTIRVKNPDGGRALNYEGNWRDIFQNWEALGASFPGFLPGMIARFVNASTVDGFNPYRVTRDGIEWEVADPDDPWSHIGYWGDHQIIYLLKFLEALPRFAPGELEDLLTREIFSYAEVPYRLKPYAEILADPRNTIVYDTELAAAIEARVETRGTDGKLVTAPGGGVLHVSLLEKLLVPMLSKLSNLVADGGIWINTQRPEWNDANNALVGNGVSVVTLAYLRRYLAFLQRLVAEVDPGPVPVSTEVAAWFHRVGAILEDARELCGEEPVSDADRKRLLDALGAAFSDYRERVYAHGFSGKEPLAAAGVAAFCRTALAHVDHALRANRREDGLYHAYNLLEIGPGGDEAALGRLYEMLEGQVAVLSSGLIEPEEAVDLVDALFASRLYCEHRRSFLLYPERSLPAFMDRNVVRETAALGIPLLAALLEEGDESILARDADGMLRFHADFQNAADLRAALDRLNGSRREAVARDGRKVLDLFELVFDHRAFTGRSGTMYGYEGLGCIYWHMVAKLLLAVQEVALRAERENRSGEARRELKDAYYRIRSGFGFEKTAEEYGAFPTDPYSHTPATAGAQQPGMTGQVKEEILTRFGELGVTVENGTLGFRPVLLRRREFLSGGGEYRYLDLEGTHRVLDVPPRGLAFTYCQVPVIYRLVGEEPWIRVIAAHGPVTEVEGDRLPAAVSGSIFGRTGEVAGIEVGVPEDLLFE